MLENASCEHYGYYYEDILPLKINIIACVLINLILIIPTILLNSIILVIFLRNHKDSLTTNALLTNLVIADLIMGCFNDPFTAAEFLMIYKQQDPCTLSSISTPISFAIGIVAFTTLAALAIDGYIQICHPFTHQRLQKKYMVWGVVLFIWALPVYPVLDLVLTKSMKVIDLFILLHGSCNMIINVYCYSAIYYVIRNHRKRIREEAERFGISQTQRKDTSIALCGFILLLSMTLCFIPIIILSGLSTQTKREDKRLIGYLTYWTWTFVGLNSLFNPVLKFYRLSSVRSALKKLWRKRFGRVVSPTTSRSITTKM